MGGFAKVDNGLGLILISTRRGYRGTEAYEKKGQITLSFTSQEKEKHFFYIYDEIASPEKGKSSANRYYYPLLLYFERMQQFELNKHGMYLYSYTVLQV